MNPAQSIEIPWPLQRPDFPQDFGPSPDWWLDEHCRFFTSLPHQMIHREMSILELGSFLGHSSLQFLKLFPQSKITCVDIFEPGDPVFEVRIKLQTYCRQMLERFQSNLWEERARIKILKSTTTQALMHLALNSILHFDLIYIDALHTPEAVFSDLILSQSLFPRAQIVGDDFQLFPQLRDGLRAFNSYLKKRGYFTRAVHGTQLWWIQDGSRALPRGGEEI